MSTKQVTKPPVREIVTIIRQFYGPDGTALTYYSLQNGHTNTMPTKLFNRKFKTIKTPEDLKIDLVEAY